ALVDRTSGKPIGMSIFHWARSENLLHEVKSSLFADKVRELNLGRIMVLDGLYVSSDRKSTRLNSIHVSISYAVFCLKKKKTRSWRKNWKSKNNDNWSASNS